MRRRRELVFVLSAVAIAALVLIAGIDQSGIWEPHELERAELARRIAVNAFHTDGLAIAGDRNAMPTLTDLGAGELGFTSMAWGLAAFGLSAWAGRLPLALWAFAGAMVLLVYLWRFFGARAAWFGVVALATMPLYFVEARTMIGDAVTMAAFGACFCGLSGAMLDPARPVRAAWLLLAVAGGAAGFLSRGVLFGVAAPLLGVGLGWIALAGSSPALVLPRSAEPPLPAHPGAWRGLLFAKRAVPGARIDAFVVGLSAALAGAIACWAGLALLFDAPSLPEPEVSRALGFARLPAPPAESTFDLTLRDLGHALFPWSAFLPLALARMWTMSTLRHNDPAARRSAACVLFISGSVAAYGMHALVLPYSGALPFVAPVLLAAVIAIALDDFAASGSASGVVGAGTLVLAVVLAADFDRRPETAFRAFGIADPGLPKLIVPGATAALVGLAFAAAAALFWLDDDDPRPVARWLYDRRRAYLTSWAALETVWSGNLAFGFLVLESMLVGLAAMIAIGRRVEWANVAELGSLSQRIGLNAWWFVPLAIVLVPAAFEAARAAAHAAVSALRITRATAFALCALAAGIVLAFDFYPALASQLSPKQALTAYARLHRPGEPLGLLDVTPRVARYHAKLERLALLSGPRAAAIWLDEGSAAAAKETRWLVVRRKDLAAANGVWRELRGANLPVRDAGGGAILLCASDLAGASNQNPLDRYILPGAPDFVQHQVDASFDHALDALGWEIRDGDGRLSDEVVPTRRYHMRFFFRVTAPIVRNHRAFVHVDRDAARHNGDHDVLGGEYKMNLWRPGDVVADPYDLVLDPGFAPGWYVVYYGFYSGEQRMPVVRGRHHENRVVGGWLHVK